MAKRWNRTETWIGLFVLAIAGGLLAVGGLFIYRSATATPLFESAGSVPAAAGGRPPEKFNAAVERARQVVRASVAERNLPGASVAVAIDNQIVWTEGFGWADLDKRSPVTPDTRFRIGTASTILTSAAAGLLIEKDLLQLDDEIQKYVPEFPTKEWPLTVRQVMGHVAGIRSDGGDEGPLFGEHCDDVRTGVRLVSEYPLRFQPGTQYRFSNFGWIMISAAIEAAADEPFVAFMQQQIFAPLRMDGTLPDSLTETIQDRATSYFPKFAADPRYGPDLMREIDLSCYAGAAAFLSTPSDLVRFALAVNTGELLKPETTTLLHTSLRLASGEQTGYGLGWDLETVTVAGKQTQWIGHDGDVLGGVAGTLAILPEHRLVISVLSNTSYADTPALALKIAEAFAAR